jgi:hypothetical protein
MTYHDPRQTVLAHLRRRIRHLKQALREFS